MNLNDLVKQDPWALLSYLPREYHRLLSGAAAATDDSGAPLVADWSPAVDIEETDEQFVVRADIPGVNPEDIEVTLENGVLTITGTREDEVKEERKGFRRVERFKGRFFRRFSLPESAAADDVKARTEKGVVEIVIPKSRQRQARRIQVDS